jgi:hypothetical protein
VKRLTASAVPRALACPASLVLPQSEYRTEYADQGHERHEEMEDAAEHDRSKLPDEVQRLIMPGDVLGAEMAFAYDVATDTARDLGPIAKRDYERAGLRPYELAGTPDLIIVGNGRIVVCDYKSFAEVDHAETNEQTMTYALMVARCYGFDSVTVAIVYLVANRRPTIATVYGPDLDAHAARLRKLQSDIVTVAKNPTAHASVNEHCRYCPAFLACPAQKQLTSDAGNGLVSVRVEAAIPFVDDAEAADAYELLGRIGLIHQRLRAALYARAAERPIPLHSGKMFGPVAKEGNEKLDADIVYDVVRAKHGQAIADSAVKRVATKTQLKSALGFVGAKSVAAEEREVLKLVRERGGSKRETKTVIEEYDAGLRLVAAGDE